MIASLQSLQIQCTVCFSWYAASVHGLVIYEYMDASNTTVARRMLGSLLSADTYWCNTLLAGLDGKADATSVNSMLTSLPTSPTLVSSCSL